MRVTKATLPPRCWSLKACSAVEAKRWRAGAARAPAGVVVGTPFAPGHDRGEGPRQPYVATGREPKYSYRPLAEPLLPVQRSSVPLGRPQTSIARGQLRPVVHELEQRGAEEEADQAAAKERRAEELRQGRERALAQARCRFIEDQRTQALMG